MDPLDLLSDAEDNDESEPEASGEDAGDEEAGNAAVTDFESLLRGRQEAVGDASAAEAAADAAGGRRRRKKPKEQSAASVAQAKAAEEKAMLNKLKHDCFGAASLMYQEAEAKAEAQAAATRILDYSTEESEGDKRMRESLGGDFCRKCGQKLCRCVDYSVWGASVKSKPGTAASHHNNIGAMAPPGAAKRPRLT
eukprot:TRINITY_DN59316_c0_g1_i1.p1 TRINITY_DN59316_c0_g1~~TRINITY_DN59316_c0_g1_i1.p1  ORF type:complete len:210 (-),score=66.18 TRINITY_DN59316_c0_g1_i1:184-768(-)